MNQNLATVNTYPMENSEQQRNDVRPQMNAETPQHQFIVSDDGRGLTHIFTAENVENVNPIEKFASDERRKATILEKTMQGLTNPFSQLLPESFYEEKAEESWQRILQEIEASVVPANFIALLTSQSKRDQERLMRGQNITPFQLAKFYFRAYQEHGFLYSNYRFDFPPSNISVTDMPMLAYVDTNNILKTAGPTQFTPGQIRQVIEQRKVIVAKVLDNGQNWHCFFQTFRSLAGKEVGGVPHFHYISDKWNHTREELLNSFRSSNYKATKVHIGITGLRKR